MKWGIVFLAWVLAGLYLANACVDYLRLWIDPVPGYTRARVLPHLQTCGTQQSVEFGKVTIGLVALYYGSGWVSTRLRKKKSGRRAEERRRLDRPQADRLFKKV